MARLKRLAPTQLAEVGATKKYELGQRYEQAATSLHGEKEYMYIQFDDGSSAATCGDGDVLVPYFTGSTGAASRYIYTSDKTEMSINAGRRSGIAKGSFTSTNLYGFIQIKGEATITSGSASLQPGEQLMCTTAGTDKVAEASIAALTITTADFIAVRNSFCECLDGSATLTTADIVIYMYGF